MKTHRIALIPGDGIGPAVTDAAWALLMAAGTNAKLEGTRFDWSCAHYKQNRRHDARRRHRYAPRIRCDIAWRSRLAGGGPGSVSLHGLLLPIRKAFVQYANIRPHRLLPGSTDR